MNALLQIFAILCGICGVLSDQKAALDEGVGRFLAESQPGPHSRKTLALSSGDRCITFENHCLITDAAVAIHYVSGHNTIRTKGWYNVDPGQKHKICWTYDHRVAIHIDKADLESDDFLFLSDDIPVVTSDSTLGCINGKRKFSIISHIDDVNDDVDYEDEARGTGIVDKCTDLGSGYQAAQFWVIPDGDKFIIRCG